jgi:hypothetical protein
VKATSVPEKAPEIRRSTKTMPSSITGAPHKELEKKERGWRGTDIPTL